MTFRVNGREFQTCAAASTCAKHTVSSVARNEVDHGAFCCFCSSEWHFMMSIHLFLCVRTHNEPTSRPAPLLQSIMGLLQFYTLHQSHKNEPKSVFWGVFFDTTAAFFFKSSSSSQSPFNGISINLLNGFKNGLALVRVSKARIGPGKSGHSLAELDVFQGDSAPTGRLRLMELMGLEEAANPTF